MIQIHFQSLLEHAKLSTEMVANKVLLVTVGACAVSAAIFFTIGWFTAPDDDDDSSSSVSSASEEQVGCIGCWCFALATTTIGFTVLLS